MQEALVPGLRLGNISKTIYAMGTRHFPPAVATFRDFDGPELAGPRELARLAEIMGQIQAPEAHQDQGKGGGGWF